MQVRKENTERWAAWMPAVTPEEPEGYSEDGYIWDQDCFSKRWYRAVPACCNCCGCVAVYNLLHHRGQTREFESVLREMERMHVLVIPGPTRMHVMRRYLRKYLPGWRETRGRQRCLEAARDSEMGVFRYWEQEVPHFVSYYRLEDGRFRFLNIGLESELRCSMERFVAGHCIRDAVRLIYWD